MKLLLACFLLGGIAGTNTMRISKFVQMLERYEKVHP
jgi:hypothetical protein